MNKRWFKAKTYGWGWTPASKEGWIVTLLFLVLTVVNSTSLASVSTLSTLEAESKYQFFYAFQAFLIISLLLICYLKGEKPSWRWGNASKKK
jgi:uncharacterized membrane protein YhaH (DUF805 family)